MAIDYKNYNPRGIVLPPNKPSVRFFCDLDISITTGFVANLDETGQRNDAIWIDRFDTNSFQHHIGSIPLSHDGIQFEVILDSDKIFSLDLDTVSTQVLNYRLEFDHRIQPRQLCFSTTGFNADHMILIGDELGARPAIRIESIKLQNIDIYRCISTKTWNEFLAISRQGIHTFTDNHAWSVTFETPIYYWLLRN